MSLISMLAWVLFAVTVLVAVLVAYCRPAWRADLREWVGPTVLLSVLVSAVPFVTSGPGGPAIYRCIGRNLSDPISTTPPDHAACMWNQRLFYANGSLDYSWVPAVIGTMVVIAILMALWVRSRSVGNRT